jgi:hypothetical protein
MVGRSFRRFGEEGRDRRGRREERRKRNVFPNLERERDENNGIFLPQNQINIPSS